MLLGEAVQHWGPPRDLVGEGEMTGEMEAKEEMVVERELAWEEVLGCGAGDFVAQVSVM